MMKLRVELEGAGHEVSLDLGRDAAGADIDGRHYDLVVHEVGEREYLLLDGFQVYRCRIEAVRETPNSLEVTLRGHSYEVTVIDPKRLRSGQGAGTHDHGSARIISPMPGKIVKVLVTEGEHVETGAGIVVVEAMKMQNEMKAPKAGVVVSLHTEAGTTVNAGDLLAVIE